ncbi:hypothetical protein K501DRAFT_288346 [Backusella circina FSU 941]|nr:hypothetical protein K501DRAFT_288346 [Backusella circina FSU 941]
MKVILSVIAGASLATVSIVNIWQALEPWANQIITACTTADSHLIRTAFTGQPIVDNIMCMSVAYYQHILHDMLGRPFQRLMMGSYATAMMIMATEGSRQSTSASLLSLYPLFLMLANCIGLSTVFLLWIPLSLYYQHHQLKDLPSRSVKYARAFGCLSAIIIGFVVPSAYMTSSWIEPNSRMEVSIIAIWQFIPILIIPLSALCEKIFDWMGSYIDELQDEQLKERLYRAEGKDAVERSYIILGTINMFAYLGSYLQVGWTGINLKEAIVMLYNAPGSLPSGLSFSDIGQLLTTRSVFIDYVVLWLAFIFWAILSSGVIAGFIMALVSMAIGPGAAVAFYAYYREGQIQDLQEPTVLVVEEEKEEDKEANEEEEEE